MHIFKIFFLPENKPVYFMLTTVQTYFLNSMLKQFPRVALGLGAGRGAGVGRPPFKKYYQ